MTICCTGLGGFSGKIHFWFFLVHRLLRIFLLNQGVTSIEGKCSLGNTTPMRSEPNYIRHWQQSQSKTIWKGLWVFILIYCSTFSFLPNMRLRLTFGFLTQGGHCNPPTYDLVEQTFPSLYIDHVLLFWKNNFALSISVSYFLSFFFSLLSFFYIMGFVF